MNPEKEGVQEGEAKRVADQSFINSEIECACMRSRAKYDEISLDENV